MTSKNGRVFGVLVTYQRPCHLEASLAAIAHQTRQLDGLVVVDNDPTSESDQVIRPFAEQLDDLRYVAAPTNLGPAGGRALGTESVMSHADDGDWIVFFDDDDPLPIDDLLRRLTAFAARMTHHDRCTAGVGLRGARMDRRTGRLIAGRGTSSVLRVDHLHGGFFPCYSASALRRVGTFRAELFYGFEELELGLRLGHAGWRLYTDDELYGAVAHLMGHPPPVRAPTLELTEPSALRYFALRNALRIMIDEGLPLQAAAWSLLSGILKPLMWMPVTPARASAHLRLNAAAIRDAWVGRTKPPNLGPRGRGTSPGSKLSRSVAG